MSSLDLIQYFLKCASQYTHTFSKDFGVDWVKLFGPGRLEDAFLVAQKIAPDVLADMRADG